jgi:7-keto-8-aminopelargonate synthetase-like enzyme
MLRTSVMATHTEADIAEALRVFEVARSTSA